jgi:hypothetical protein
VEIAKVEIEAVEKVASEAPNLKLVTLNDLQLALVGGGTGDVVFG